MNDIYFKCIGCITMFLYAAAVDKFVLKEALGAKPPIRMSVFALSMLTICKIVRYRLGIIWIAFNIILLAVLSQIRKRKIQKPTEGIDDEQENENEQIL